jgi:hypothetical protein
MQPAGLVEPGFNARQLASEYGFSGLHQTATDLTDES